MSYFAHLVEISDLAGNLEQEHWKDLLAHLAETVEQDGPAILLAIARTHEGSRSEEAIAPMLDQLAAAFRRVETEEMN